MNVPSSSPAGSQTPMDESSIRPQSPPAPRRVAILGVGLLGGSFGLAIRKRFPGSTVVGVSRSESSRQAAIDRGAIHEATSDLRQACRDADWVVIGTPVDRIAEMAIAASEVCRDGTLITDLGSTKAGIVGAIEADATASRLFVGSHPIAGGEKTGAEHARDDLFQGRTTVLTPTERTDRGRLSLCRQIWESIGSRVVILSPQEHDEALAAVSHVPHLVASLLANLPDERSRELAGTGWLDTTRVASGDPEMWAAICAENRDAIVAQLDRAGAALREFRDAIAQDNTARLVDLLAIAKRHRDAARRPTGPPPDHSGAETFSRLSSGNEKMPE
jgi:prephenate dehydrogenase